jgi:Fur family ferric uptake transcriptional regulator
VLREADGFRTAQQLHADLKRRGEAIGLTTVYRHLNLLVEAGTIDAVHGADGESRFRLCGSRSPSGAAEPLGHHHHVVCRTCGRAVEVEGPEIEVWALAVAEAAGFTDITHTLEIFGLCPQHTRPSDT